MVDSRLQIAENQEDIAKAFEGVSEDLGYKVKVIYTDPSNSPQLIDVDENGNEYIKDGTAYVDKLKTAGGSVSLSQSSIPISGVGINYANRDLESVIKNTVVGNVEIGKSSGDEINKDLASMTEITKDKDTKTDIFIESQTINYIKNPEKFKEDLQY